MLSYTSSCRAVVALLTCGVVAVTLLLAAVVKSGVQTTSLIHTPYGSSCFLTLFAIFLKFCRVAYFIRCLFLYISVLCCYLRVYRAVIFVLASYHIACIVLYQTCGL